MPNSLGPAFVHDKGSYERVAFGAVLVELHKNFIPLDPDADDRISNILQNLCENSYRNGQLLRKWFMEEQGLWVE